MRETILFNEGWRYYGDDYEVELPVSKGPAYMQAKTECRLLGPAAREYEDRGLSERSWRTVNLPHDYVIEQTPHAEGNEGLGCFKQHNAWYRKHFTLPAEDEGRRVCLYFEGVATHAQVYVNGCLAGRNFCGYTPFELDVTSFVRFGEENAVAVYVNSTSSCEGWWYQGGGIYRNVWLIKTDRAHFVRDGLFVHPERLAGDAWRVPVEAELANTGDAARNLRLACRLEGPDGATLCAAETEVAFCADGFLKTHLALSADAPERWDIEHPALYTLCAALYEDGAEIDRAEARFGFRTFRFDANEGFFLNERPVKIQGVNCHQDYGLTGKVLPPRVARHRVELLKEMGANAYRSCHYMQSEDTLSALAEVGMLALCETRWFSTEPEAVKQLETLIRRDRNNPSVILWSVGNEEPLHKEKRGLEIAKRLFAKIRALDPTRPVTTVVCHDVVNAPVHAVCDVLSVNYNLSAYDALHAKYPDKPFVAGELCACGTTRGWYEGEAPERGYRLGYDHEEIGTGFASRERTWKHVMARAWVAGGFQWAGIEHRGECVWPRLCSQSGALDLFLQKKDAFYQNQSHWTKAPMIHLLPHWNHAGLEGREIEVWAYTNCPEAELFLDGESLGRAKVEPYGHAAWRVAYRPGRLSAVGYRDGAVVCEDAFETSGLARRLRLTAEAVPARADGMDVALLACDCLDAEGRVVPDAEAMIHFGTNGLGTILGTGSDISDHEPVAMPDRRMRAGRAALCVRVGKTAGTLCIYARAEGLASAALDIPLGEA